MRLLVKKQRNGKKGIASVSINKSGLSILGSFIKRLIDPSKNNYAAIGFDNDGNICLYVSTRDDGKLFKLYHTKQGDYWRANISSKAHKKSLEPYLGNYDIKQINRLPNGMREVVLKKY